MQSYLRPKTNIEIKTEKNLKKNAILLNKGAFVAKNCTCEKLTM